MDSIPVVEIIWLVILGLFAGAVGGLVGIGGSLIIIPVLTLLMDKSQHLSQAAAMIVNVFVAAPSLFRHHQAQTVRWDVMVRMLPFGLVFILLGVWASDKIDGNALKKIFGAFLLYIIAFNIMKLFEEAKNNGDKPERTGWIPIGIVGTIMGFTAGLLGIGGGAIAAPLLQRVCRLPLRQAIATSTAVMCITASIGAWTKNAGLDQITNGAAGAIAVTYKDSLLIAICIVPTAIIGALFGARLTHVLPLRFLRIAFILLMLWACVNMLGLLP